MKVHELLAYLDHFDPDSEVKVLVSNPLRGGSGSLEEIQSVHVTFDQDTNKGFCVIETQPKKADIV